ncbi:MAG: D-alanyl-D-alanine carboxypeptidase family protein [Methylobacter sp.]|uniref:D-alanyl-D-alanine carboxypeptidase family protein n=1 Tax=Methylobacter sp. TaxID=2051955 RepID=UPI00273220C6|nr:D-alanyl-D-alanine carboxypeptidase family protein [Methylobacter sp.]MDP1666868.1 D-alanyl-D-alanine carboxypeptidase family protein [Methylobacter sp.]
MTKVKLTLLILNAVWLFAVSEVSYGRHAAIIIDADNGNVLHEVDATQSWYPASLTKLMTLYMTFDALKAGQIHLYDTLTASTHASQQPNSKLGLRRGEHLTVEDAVLAIITRSANDASVVLAEHLGNTEQDFAVNMTAKAHSLGMYNTNFMNATGLPNNWQVTTSRDMAVLAWKAQRNFPEYYHYFAAHSFNFRGAELRGINKFTANYPGAEGMKTGFTCGSGFNLIGAAHQNGRHLIGVVMGGMTSKERYQLMMQKMDASFANLTSFDPVRNITTMPVSAAGSPPYQLDCGNGGATHSIPASNRVNYTPKRRHISRIKTSTRGTKTTRPKTVARTKTSIKPVNKSKLLPKAAKQAKASVKPVSNLQVKNKNFHKPKADTKASAKTKSTQKVALH